VEQYRPMRSLTSRKYVYVWNAWSNGKNVLPRTMGNGDEVTRFLDANSDRENYGARSQFYKCRVPEELYDTQRDPGCLNNLIAAAEYRQVVAGFRKRMLRLMRETQDPELPGYRASRE